jgi:hypothetical protein
MVGSEVCLWEVRKTEILMEKYRRAIGIGIKEAQEVWEGVMTELEPIKRASATGSSWKRVTVVQIRLRTMKSVGTLRCDGSGERAMRIWRRQFYSDAEGRYTLCELASEGGGRKDLDAMMSQFLRTNNTEIREKL